jgi:hypothetical protein
MLMTMSGARKTGDPEFELLLYAARTDVDAHAAQRIVDIIENGVEWGHLLFLGRHHRVLELLYQSLRRHAPSAIRGEVESYLRNEAHRTVAFNMILLRELVRMYRMLGEKDIEMISFKGPLLAQLAYGNLGLRSSVDLDFLIRPKDLGGLEEVVKADGFEVAQRMTTLSPFQKHAYLRLARQISYVNGTRGIGLDVHTNVMPPGYRYKYSFEELLARSRVVEAVGRPVRVFAEEDMLHLLCFHGVKNRWDQLKYVCDVGEVVRSHQDLNWDEVLSRAEDTRGERVLYHGLHLARLLLDTPLPPEVIRRIGRASYVDRLAEIAVENLLNSSQQMLNQRTRIEFHLKTQDGLVNKSRYVMYSLMRHVGGVIDI